MPRSLNNRVKLHPITIREIRKGHPWVIADSFTAKFPSNELMLIGQDQHKKEIALLLNDPTHKKIKARVWSTTPPFADAIKNFKTELYNRLVSSFQKRKKILDERENVYLTFGESDSLPGLFIQLLGSQILVQYYANLWKQQESSLLSIIPKALKAAQLGIDGPAIWTQKRNEAKKIIIESKDPTAQKEFIVSEFGIKYLIRINRHYDNGIYSDMAAVRKQLLPQFNKADSVLNLFAYTGAFSLNALKHGATNVVSVDLSKKYIKWLEENIAINNFNKEYHTSITQPVLSALEQLQKNRQRFDFIICDPPSASSDGKKKTNALKSYEAILPKLCKLCNSNGKILVLINTHGLSWDKFEKRIKSLLPQSTKITKRFNLAEDCLTPKIFKEGNYLKGLLLSKS